MVGQRIKNRVHQYVMNLNDEDFETPSYVSEMIERKNEIVFLLIFGVNITTIDLEGNKSPKFNKEQKEQKTQSPQQNVKHFNKIKLGK